MTYHRIRILVGLATCLFMLSFVLHAPLYALENGRKTADVPPQAAADHLLARTAHAMKPGEWKELTGTGLNPEMVNCGNGPSHIFQYSTDLQWSSITQELYFIGQGHYAGMKAIRYNAGTNKWSSWKIPEFVKPNEQGIPYPIGHTYDGAAMDDINGIYYYRQCRTPKVYRFDVRTEKWLDPVNLPNTGKSDFGFRGGIDCFPELGGLVFLGQQSGSVHVLDHKTGQWKTLTSKPLSMGMHAFTEYNPVHKQFLFGGGIRTKENHLYRLQPDGRIQTLTSAPVQITSSAGQPCTVDPVSGDYLVFDGDKRTLQAFDPVKSEWRKIALEGCPLYGNKKAARRKQMLMAPVADHGVVVFCVMNKLKTWVYKGKK